MSSSERKSLAGPGFTELSRSGSGFPELSAAAAGGMARSTVTPESQLGKLGGRRAPAGPGFRDRHWPGPSARPVAFGPTDSQPNVRGSLESLTYGPGLGTQ
jgi:hypothetical protein